MKPSLNPAERVVLRVLTEAAEAGHRCPSNWVIAAHANCGLAHAQDLIAALEEKGLIRVQRSHNHRVVTLIETGRATAGKVSLGDFGQRRDRASEQAKREFRRASAIEGLKTAKTAAVHAEAFVGAVAVPRETCFRCGARSDFGCRHLGRMG